MTPSHSSSCGAPTCLDLAVGCRKAGDVDDHPELGLGFGEATRREAPTEVRGAVVGPIHHVAGSAAPIGHVGVDFVDPGVDRGRRHLRSRTPWTWLRLASGPAGREPRDVRGHRAPARPAADPGATAPP